MRCFSYIFMSLGGVLLLCLPILIDFLLQKMIRNDVEQYLKILLNGKTNFTIEETLYLQGIGLKFQVYLYNLSHVDKSHPDNNQMQFPLKYSLLRPFDFSVKLIDQQYVLASSDSLMEPFINVNILKVVSSWLNSSLDLIEKSKTGNLRRKELRIKKAVADISKILNLDHSLFQTLSVRDLIQQLNMIVKMTNTDKSAHKGVQNFGKAVIVVYNYLNKQNTSSIVYDNDELMLLRKRLININDQKNSFGYTPMVYLPRAPYSYRFPYFEEPLWIYSDVKDQSGVTLYNYIPSSDWLAPILEKQDLKNTLEISGIQLQGLGLTDDTNATTTFSKSRVIIMDNLDNSSQIHSSVSVLYPAGIPTNASLGFRIDLQIPKEKRYDKLQTLEVPYAQVWVTLENSPTMYQSLISIQFGLRQFLYIILFMSGAALILLPICIGYETRKSTMRVTFNQKDNTVVTAVY